MSFNPWMPEAFGRHHFPATCVLLFTLFMQHCKILEHKGKQSGVKLVPRFPKLEYAEGKSRMEANCQRQRRLKADQKQTHWDWRPATAQCQWAIQGRHTFGLKTLISAVREQQLFVNLASFCQAFRLRWNRHVCVFEYLDPFWLLELSAVDTVWRRCPRIDYHCVQ